MFSLVKTKAIIPFKPNLLINFSKALISAKIPRLTAYTCIIQDKRTLYSRYSLGVEGFLHQGTRFRYDIENWEDAFVKKMEDLAESADKKQIVYTEDLRRLIALCQQKLEYFDLVIALTKMYKEQIKEFNIQPFRFGPCLIRLTYIHNLPDKALEILSDEDLSSYINEESSYQVAMDLLYENGRYEDVLKLMKSMVTCPKSCATLALISCYRISTDEALDYSLEVFRRLYENRLRPTFKMMGLTSWLALQKEKPEIALEICANSVSQRHYFLINPRIVAKARIGQLEEVMDILKSVATVDLPNTSPAKQKKPLFCHDVIEEVEKILTDKQDMDLLATFTHLKGILKDTNNIASETFHESVIAPVVDYIPEENPEQSRRYHQPRNQRDGSRPRFSNQRNKPFESYKPRKEHLDRY